MRVTAGTAPLMSIEDTFRITKGDIKNWDLKGYNVPSTSFHSPRSYKIPSERKKDSFYNISKLPKDPDPTTYSPTFTQLQKRYWQPANGAFLKSRRHSITEDVMKYSAKFPGPGDYLKTVKGSSQPLTKALLGKFDKDTNTCFLNDVEYRAEQSPSSTQYFTKAEDREKAYGKIERRSPGFKYYPNKAKSPAEKAITGPGYLKDLEDSYQKKSLSTAAPKFKFAKSKIVRKSEEIANNHKFVPGVGHYKDKEKAFTSYVLEHKERMPFISKSKDVRFTESYTKAKSWVPGPGSYDPSPDLESKANRK